MLLEFQPSQPHDLLKADGRTLTAGETFEASEKDVEMLLANPEIRKVEAKSESSIEHHEPKLTQSSPLGIADTNQIGDQDAS